VTTEATLQTYCSKYINNWWPADLVSLLCAFPYTTSNSRIYRV